MSRGESIGYCSECKKYWDWTDIQFSRNDDSTPGEIVSMGECPQCNCTIHLIGESTTLAYSVRDALALMRYLGRALKVVRHQGNDERMALKDFFASARYERQRIIEHNLVGTSEPEEVPEEEAP